MRLPGYGVFGCVLTGGLGVAVWQREAKKGEALRMDSWAAKRRFSGPTRRVIIGEVGGVGLDLDSCEDCLFFSCWVHMGVDGAYGTSAGLVGLRRRSMRRELGALGLSRVLRVRAAALAAR